MEASALMTNDRSVPRPCQSREGENIMIRMSVPMADKQPFFPKAEAAVAELNTIFKDIDLTESENDFLSWACFDNYYCIHELASVIRKAMDAGAERELACRREAGQIVDYLEALGFNVAGKDDFLQAPAKYKEAEEPSGAGLHVCKYFDSTFQRYPRAVEATARMNRVLGRIDLTEEEDIWVGVLCWFQSGWIDHLVSAVQKAVDAAVEDAVRNAQEGPDRASSPSGACA